MNLGSLCSFLSNIPLIPMPGPAGVPLWRGVWPVAGVRTSMPLWRARGDVPFAGAKNVKGGRRTDGRLWFAASSSFDRFDLSTLQSLLLSLSKQFPLLLREFVLLQPAGAKAKSCSRGQSGRRTHPAYINVPPSVCRATFFLVFKIVKDEAGSRERERERRGSEPIGWADGYMGGTERGRRGKGTGSHPEIWPESNSA